MGKDQLTTSTATGNDFDFDQHRALRQDLHDLETEARAFERYAMLAVGALWAWTVTEARSLADVVAWLSFAIGLLGGARMWTLWRLMKVKGDYIAEMERRYSSPDLGGWENYFRCVMQGAVSTPAKARSANDVHAIYDRPLLLGVTSGLFWLLLIGASFPFGNYVSRQVDRSTPPATVTVRCIASETQR